MIKFEPKVVYCFRNIDLNVNEIVGIITRLCAVHSQDTKTVEENEIFKKLSKPETFTCWSISKLADGGLSFSFGEDKDYEMFAFFHIDGYDGISLNIVDGYNDGNRIEFKFSCDKDEDEWIMNDIVDYMTWHDDRWVEDDDDDLYE